MQHLYNDPSNKERRTELRKNQTIAEKMLWSCLRGKRLQGHRFIRQYSVGPYILDFYCSEKRLAIELDGSQHMEKEAEEYDQSRTEFLNKQNIQVLRFWNNDVLARKESVLEKILWALSSGE